MVFKVIAHRKIWRCFNAIIDHFTVVGLVTWPLNGSEAGGDLVLIQTSMLLLCKSSCSYTNKLSFTWEKQRGLYQSKVTSSLACIHGQVTKHTTVKWPIRLQHIVKFCVSVWSLFGPKTNFELHYFSLSHTTKTQTEYKIHWKILKLLFCGARSNQIFGKFSKTGSRFWAQSGRNRFLHTSTKESCISRN